MLKKLRLERFKSFKTAELELGPLTILVGTNASGKSNLRDAFRFLHGIGRGYNLADIVGEKYVEGGVLQWRGIRGGFQEIAFQGADSFALEVVCLIRLDGQPREVTYRIEVKLGEDGYPPCIIAEKLCCEGFEEPIFKAHGIPDWENIQSGVIGVAFYEKINEEIFKPSVNHLYALPNIKPILSQIKDWHQSEFFKKKGVDRSMTRKLAVGLLATLSEMRFLDLNPDSMRVPSIPGQPLGDRGENLSSVLQAICQDPQRKQSLLHWIQELTPMDARDFEFPADFTGKILLRLVEENGQKISAYSASDGTLRFLAAIAILLEPELNAKDTVEVTPPYLEPKLTTVDDPEATTNFYFVEELDNGIHPTRLQLLLELIERKAADGSSQIVTTTHSPQLLRFLSLHSLESVSLTYRLPDQPDAKIKRILDIPDAQRVIQKQNIAHLHESGWLEDVVDFLEEEETSP